jgi:hypothetical protein
MATGTDGPTRARGVVDEAELARWVDRLVPTGGSPAQLRLYRSMLGTVARLAAEGTQVIDLKLADSALAEMAEAFRVFRPFRRRRKVTIFGSARTLPDDPLYAQARRFAAAIAAHGWMVVTGAGPGIMAAGLEGAGRDRSFGINIRLPFESVNPFIGGDPKLIEMKYFFTRKLALMKESQGFVVLPGGFGTLDELLELLTLLQTGKAAPAPIVCLGVPGLDYWEGWQQFVDQHVAVAGLISADDRNLYRLTDDADAAVAELRGFYRNYRSLRYVGDTLVIRLAAAPGTTELEQLSVEFADICVEGGIESTPPLAAEVADDDHLELARVGLQFDRRHHGRLRQLIDGLNRLASAPALA